MLPPAATAAAVGICADSQAAGLFSVPKRQPSTPTYRVSRRPAKPPRITVTAAATDTPILRGRLSLSFRSRRDAFPGPAPRLRWTTSLLSEDSSLANTGRQTPVRGETSELGYPSQPLSDRHSMRSTRTLFWISAKQVNQSTLHLNRYISSARNLTPIDSQVRYSLNASPFEITATVGNRIHEHIRIDENSNVAFIANSERTLCTLSRLYWNQVVDIMSPGNVNVFHYPHFMKLHPSLVTYLRNDLKYPTNIYGSRMRNLTALRSLLSIQFFPLVVADNMSLRAVADSLFDGFALRSATYKAYSPAWKSIMKRLQPDNGTLSCALPPSVELGYSSHGVELADLRGLSFNCLIHLIHHAAEDPLVISIAIYERTTLMNLEARGLAQSGHGYMEPYREVGLTGAGQVCGVADSGVNDVSCFFLDDSKAYPTVTTSRNGELQPLRRKIIQYVAYADGSEDEAGHGTHVCGSIGGALARPTSSRDNIIFSGKEQR